MTAKEIRKALNSAKLVNCFVFVEVAVEGRITLPIPKETLIQEFAGWDDDEQCFATWTGADLFIGD